MTARKAARSPGWLKRLFTVEGSLTLFSIRAARWLMNVVLSLFYLGFLLLFALLLPHPLSWDTWRVVMFLHRWGDPVLELVDRWVGWPGATAYYLLVLAFVCSVAQLALDSKLQEMYRRFKESSVA